MDSAKLPLSFDPQALQKDLTGLEHVDWIDHFVQQNYEGSWTVIPLRGPRDAVHPVMMIYSDPNCTDFTDTPYLDSCSYIREVLASFQCPVNAVRLMRLTPGSVIKEHTDYDLALEDGNARLHVPIVTNPGVEFRLNGLRVEMNEGECWYLRLSDPHSVVNRGNEDRTHLVIDVSVNSWLEALIARGIHIDGAEN
jgi:quercetin dioxygenase-like cupin family protein